MTPPRKVLPSVGSIHGCSAIGVQDLSALPENTPTIGVSVSKFSTSPGIIETTAASQEVIATFPATKFTFRQVEYTSKRAFVIKCSVYKLAGAQMEIHVTYESGTGLDLNLVLPIAASEEGSKDPLSLSSMNEYLKGQMVLLDGEMRGNCSVSEYLVFFKPWAVDQTVFTDLRNKLPDCGAEPRYALENLARHVQIIADTQPRRAATPQGTIKIAPECKEGPSCMYGGSPMKVCVEYEVTVERVTDEKPAFCPILKCPSCGNADSPAPLPTNLYS